MLTARIAGTHQRQGLRRRALAGSRRSRPPVTDAAAAATGANLMAATPAGQDHCQEKDQAKGHDIWARLALDMGTAQGDAMLVSEKIGQFFVASDGGRDRLEYTEYGAGDAWWCCCRRADTPPDAAAAGTCAGSRGTARGRPRPARAHGRSDRPDDPHAYSVTGSPSSRRAADHLGAPQAVIGGVSLVPTSRWRWRPSSPTASGA